MAKDIGQFMGTLAIMFDQHQPEHAEHLADDLISLLENKDKFYDREQFKNIVYTMARQVGGE